MTVRSALLAPSLSLGLMLHLACGGGGSTSQPAPTPTLSVSPTTATLGYGNTLSLTATGANFGTAHWSVQEAGGGTVTGSGLQATYTAPNTTGTFHVLVKGDNPAVQASAEIKVLETLDYLSLVMTPHVMHVELAAAPTAFQPSQGQFMAQAQTVKGSAKSRGRREVIPPPPGEGAPFLAFSAMEDAPVTWTLLEGPAAGSINPTTGEYAPGALPGVYHLVATRKDDPKISGTIEVVVRGAGSSPLEAFAIGSDLAVYPDRALLEPGGEAYLKVTSGTVNWSLLEGLTAGTLGLTGGSDQEVKYTAPAARGVFTALATNTADPSQKAQASLEVGQRVSVSVAPSLPRVSPGGTVALTATVGNTSVTGVTWKVVEGPSGGSLAGTGNTAIYTAPSTPGKYHVQATSQADTNRSGEALVEVTGTSTVSVQLLNPPTRVESGTQAVLVASVFGNVNSAVTWSASQGTITADGLWTAPQAPGPVTVTATSAADPTKSASATLTVANLPRFTSLPPTRINISVPPPYAYAYTYSATHAGGLSMTFSLEQAPAGAILAGTTLTWTPTSTQGSVTNTFILKATDSEGGIARQQWTIDSVLEQGLAFLSSNIWAWSTGTTAGVVRIRPDGTYLQAQANPADFAGKPGVEVGTVSLGGFDANGFWHTPGITKVDTNLEWGLSHPQACDRLRPSVTHLEFGGCSGNGWSSIQKMENDPSGIVGAWAFGSATNADTPLFLFFSNGTYLIADPRVGSSLPCETPGIEFGSYAYNLSTKVLSTSINQYDTNGCAGLHDTRDGSYGTPTWTLSPDGMSMTVVGGAGAFTFYRVSK